MFFDDARLQEVVKVHLFLDEVPDDIHSLSAVETNVIVFHMFVELKLYVGDF